MKKKRKKSSASEFKSQSKGGSFIFSPYRHTTSLPTEASFFVLALSQFLSQVEDEKKSLQGP